MPSRLGITDSPGERSSIGKKVKVKDRSECHVNGETRRDSASGPNSEFSNGRYLGDTTSRPEARYYHDS